jgi:hypothetical protein
MPVHLVKLLSDGSAQHRQNIKVSTPPPYTKQGAIFIGSTGQMMQLIIYLSQAFIVLNQQ